MKQSSIKVGNQAQPNKQKKKKERQENERTTTTINKESGYTFHKNINHYLVKAKTFFTKIYHPSQACRHKGRGDHLLMLCYKTSGDCIDTL